MSTYDIIVSTSESTVVSEYVPESSRSDAYQSEADLEKEFIRLLSEQGYEYLDIRNEKDLISNLRKQLQALNDYIFSNDEWNRFLNGVLANTNEGVVEKTRKIQDDHVHVLRRDDGSLRIFT